jgi:hypothetical protein
MYTGENTLSQVDSGIRATSTASTFAEVMHHPKITVVVMNFSSVYLPESESNRTFPVRVRFGSSEFLKSRFGFGSVRLNFQKVSSGSVRFD